MMEAFGHGDMLAKRDSSTGCTLRKSELLDMVTKNHSLLPRKLDILKKTVLKSQKYQQDYTIAML
jgi:hypothetical protein